MTDSKTAGSQDQQLRQPSNNNNNNFTNLNSIKSKQFQMYTRKLLEIALEMLLKSQVPSVQYISLTTINRIFDIYVYHNLFYPGFYESCYIPLPKRQMNRIHQKKMHDSNLMKANADQDLKLQSSDNYSAGKSNGRSSIVKLNRVK